MTARVRNRRHAKDGHQDHRSIEGKNRSATNERPDHLVRNEDIMTFQITALDHRRFTRLFELSDSELAENMAVRRTATAKPGFPCRVSLADAEVGEELILVNYEHQSSNSPYRAAHAIFVRKGVEQAQPAAGEVPEVFRGRALSLRAFSDQGMIVAADLTDGDNLGPALDRLLANPTTAYAHIHYAKFGCYAARAHRV
jgi:Protein of unknown function (DUF1203)